MNRAKRKYKKIQKQKQHKNKYDENRKSEKNIGE